jgi:hypothetical protein
MQAAYKIIISALSILLRDGALEPEPPFTAIGQMTGADSQVEIPRIDLVQDQNAWVQAWKDHRQATTVSLPGVQNPIQDVTDRPRVDFEKNVVLCLFGGQSRNVSGFELADVGDEKGVAYVRIRPIVLPSGGAGLLQNAYMMLVLPRTKRKLTVQIDQSQLGGRGWRTLANFGPTTKDRTKF